MKGGLVMKNKKWGLLAVAVLGMVFLVASIFMVANSGKAAEKETVKIGFIGPYSGFASTDGIPMRKNFELAVKIMNEKGGILGGRKIEALYYDDGVKPDQAAAMARKAITSDKVKAICGTWETGCAIAVRDVCRDYNIPCVLSDSDGIETYMEGYYGLIHLGASPSCENAPVYWTMEQRKLKTIAIVYEEMEWSRLLSKLYHRRWDKPGSPVKIVSEVFHPLGKSELKAEYTKALASNPDGIAMCEWTGPATSAAMNTTYELGYKGIRMGFSPIANTKLLPSFGKSTDGVIMGAHFLPAPGVPSNDAYVKLYSKNVDEELANVGAMAYDAANVTMLGINKAGTDSDLKKIADAIHSLDYMMVSGNCKLKLIPEGRIQRAGEFICRIQGGKMIDVSYFPFTPEILQADIDLYKNP
jgi:branched-chain amino acid transport system substrate-binding protein